MRGTNRRKIVIKTNTKCAYNHGKIEKYIFKLRRALEYTNKLNFKNKLDDAPDLSSFRDLKNSSINR